MNMLQGIEGQLFIVWAYINYLVVLVILQFAELWSRSSSWLKGRFLNDIYSNHAHYNSSNDHWTELRRASYMITYFCILRAHSCTLNEWRFNLIPCRSLPFLSSCRASSHILRYDNYPSAIQKTQWHSRKAQVEPALNTGMSIFSLGVNRRKPTLYIRTLTCFFSQWQTKLRSQGTLHE